MADILFITMDAGGNVPPMLGIAQAVARAGHRVRVLGHHRLADEVGTYGLTLTPFSDRTWDSTRKRSALAWAPMLNDAGIGADVRRLCEDDRPDVAVVDCMLLPAHAAIDELGVPRVVLTHTYKAFLDGRHRLGAGTAARVYGYRTAARWNSAALNLVTSVQALDPAGRRRHSANVRWSGVVGPRTSPAEPRTDLPLVLVSLSTNGFLGQARTLRHIIAALGRLPVRAIVTTGGVVDPGRLPSVGNVEVVGYGDHLTIMRECSLVIGHGGHSTTFRALAHDLPVLVIPANPLTDQRMIGRSIARAGAGVLLSRRASARSISRAVETMLADPAYGKAAAAIGADIRATPGVDVAAEAVLDLARVPKVENSADG